jgi:phosphohistidine phosphatase
MELWIVRHAAAVARNPGLEDSTRPLTPRGRKRWKKAVSGLEARGVSFDALYHSPWTRAVETAEPLARLLTGERVELTELAMPPDVALLERLRGERVAVVGHSPWLEELLSLLVSGSTGAAQNFVLKKGGVAWLEGEPRANGMQLRALLPPRVLGDLSRL